MRAILIAIILTYIFKKRYQNNSPKTEELSTIIVGISADYPPFTYVDHDKIVGFDIDLMNELAHRLEKKVEFKDLPFEMLIPEIQLGHIHMMAGGMTPQEERIKHVLFTKPYIADDHLLVISRSDEPKVTSLADLNNKEIIVNEGYTADAYMSMLSGPILKRLPTVSDAFLALMSKRAFAFVTAAIAVKPFFDLYSKDVFHIYVIPSVSESYALAVGKNYKTLLMQINTELEKMKEDKFIEKLKQKWGIAS